MTVKMKTYMSLGKLNTGIAYTLTEFQFSNLQSMQLKKFLLVHVKLVVRLPYSGKDKNLIEE